MRTRSNSTTAIIVGLCFCFGLCFGLSTVSEAAPVTWYLNNVTLTGGGSLTGSITYDHDTTTLSAWSITSSPGAPAISCPAGGCVWTNATDANTVFGIRVVADTPTFTSFALGTIDNESLLIALNGQLTDAGGTVPMVGLSANGCHEGNSADPGCVLNGNGPTGADLTGALCTACLNAGTWTTKAPMPTALAGSMAGWVKGHLYIVSGFTASGQSTANQQYTPRTNSWASKAAILTPRAYAGVGAISGKLYVVGGCTSNQDCRIGTTGANEAYNPSTDSWASLAPMPTARYGVGTGVISGKLYVVGGSGACPPCTPLTTLEVYNASSNTWSTKANMPTARRETAAVVIKNLLYVAGGADAAGNAFNTLEVYNPKTNTWATKASMPSPRRDFGAGVANVVIGGVVNHILYAISGLGANGVSLNTVDAYNPLTDSWTSVAPIPTARYLFEPAGPTNLLYVAGNGAGNLPITTMETFKP
jgi:N-acetylneuraminic acid mutarotase